MTPLEKRVLEAIDLPGLLRYLGELVAVRSLSGQETPAQESVAAQMERCGLSLDVWELDFAELSLHPAFSIEVERAHGLGVVGALGEANGGRSLIFNGHVDVVPAGDEANWRYPPWQGTVAGGAGLRARGAGYEGRPLLRPLRGQSHPRGRSET